MRVQSTEREKRTIEVMIRIFCRKKHGGEDLCRECSGLLEYANKRIDHCVFGPEKPACNDCKVHCYKPMMRERVKEVMRFSGPKMLWKHPVLAIAHLMK
jgi:hypothetical protein